MGRNLELIRATYEGTSEENGQALLAVLAPDATWTEAASFPYAGTYTGPKDIMAGVFQRLATEWDDYSAKVHTFMEDGDKVAAFGEYSGTYRATGKSFRASFAHLYVLRDGKIRSMTQFVDSALVQDALH